MGNVTGPPLAIWSLNIGTTLPLEPRTFPNLTDTNCVPLATAFMDCTTISATRLDTPIMLVGLTALSVEIIANLSAP